MKKVKVYQVDAFTSCPFGGNPAGVVTGAEGLTDHEMQLIAREMNCPETVFILPAAHPQAQIQARFFTPAEEVDLCGHGTIAAFHVLGAEKKITLSPGDNVIYQETKAGILPVNLLAGPGGDLDRVVMGQPLPTMMGICADVKTVAALLGLAESDLAWRELPLQIVSTGLPDLMVPVKNLAALKKAVPDFARLAAYQKENGFISIHAFTFETEDPAHTVHVRDFAPSVQINEEAATGTANGALAAYLVTHRALPLDREKIVVTVEQGYVMQRPSEIVAEITHAGGQVLDVKVGGKAVLVLTGEITYPFPG
ncbi:PhzF family phenazine biosynthesis protein [Candidatus Formimonas warabiya]|uniref:PhzF family phenazine biosynthesis protein n=1 Tax=Formimonas warabiya TaxID=1761012 RepID=A0A3G1KV33_FORW1|nr:PhzF family phenazine biosynthesis protein [Candidatus Formimonas warabiya]ATW26296.1 hypothetical protein DCMF_17380 [Candidatus Formimonas warabiya]